MFDKVLVKVGGQRGGEGAGGPGGGGAGGSRGGVGGVAAGADVVGSRRGTPLTLALKCAWRGGGVVPVWLLA